MVDLWREPTERSTNARCFVTRRHHHQNLHTEEHTPRLARFLQASCRTRVVRAKTWAIVALLGCALYFASGRVMHLPFPSDRTPEGAYLRIAKSIDEGHPAEIFPYLESEAQWASYSIRDARAEAVGRVAKSFPEPSRTDLLAAYGPFARAPDGADVFALYAQQKGWVDHLRRDLSGIARVETDGPRATVVTARGTRYPFRRRDNGIWGLTLFTAQLLAESERAARDLASVSASADDYERAKAPGK